MRPGRQGRRHRRSGAVVVALLGALLPVPVASASASTISPATLNLAAPLASSTSTAVGGLTTFTSTLTVQAPDHAGATSVTLATSTFTSTGGFHVETPLQAGSTLRVGQSISLSVAFQPQVAGPASATWTFSTTGGRPVSLQLMGVATGVGYVLPTPSYATWSINGGAYLVGGLLQLTQSVADDAGSALFPVAVSTAAVTISCNVTVSNQSPGGDGAAILLASPSTQPNAVGGFGAGMGFAGLSGLAVVLGDYDATNASSTSYVGLADGVDPTSPVGALHYLRKVPIKGYSSLLGRTTRITVTLHGGTLSLRIGGISQDLTTSVAGVIGTSALVGFSAGTGAFERDHAISDPTITVAGPPPAAPLSMPTTLDFGAVGIGATATKTLTMTNASARSITLGDTTVSGSVALAVLQHPAAGTVLAPGAHASLVVAATPMVDGVSTATVAVSTLDYLSPTSLLLSVTGVGPAVVVPPLSPTGWRSLGSAHLSSGQAALTPATPFATGLVVANHPVSTASLSLRTQVVFTPGPRCCGDGLAVQLRPVGTAPSLGLPGAQLGISPGAGLSVALGVYRDPGTPASNWVGLAANDAAGGGRLHFVAVAAVPFPLVGQSTSLLITVVGQTISVAPNGQLLLRSVALRPPPIATLSISAATGQLTAGQILRSLVVGDRAPN